MDGFFEHVFRYPTPDVAGTQTRDFLYDTYFGIRVGTDATWLTELPLEEAGYVPGTAIVRTAQTFLGLRIETLYFVPWGLAGPGLVMLVRVTNPGGAVSGSSATVALPPSRRSATFATALWAVRPSRRGRAGVPARTRGSARRRARANA